MRQVRINTNLHSSVRWSVGGEEGLDNRRRVASRCRPAKQTTLPHSTVVNQVKYCFIFGSVTYILYLYIDNVTWGLGQQNIPKQSEFPFVQEHDPPCYS